MEYNQFNQFKSVEKMERDGSMETKYGKNNRDGFEIFSKMQQEISQYFNL